jgi:hypothetical protein
LLGNTEEIGDLVFGQVFVVMKNERGALALGDFEQRLRNYFSLLDVRGRHTLRWTRSESFYIEPFQTSASEVLASEVHDRGFEIIGEGVRLAHIGETPECPEEGLLRDVLCDLLIADQQVSKLHRSLCVSGIKLLCPRSAFLAYPLHRFQLGASSDASTHIL